MATDTHGPTRTKTFFFFLSGSVRGGIVLLPAFAVGRAQMLTPVKAEIHNLDSLSAHGDYNEILAWLEQGTLKPEKVYGIHGEMVASDVMRKRILEKFGWDAEVPDLFEEVEV